MLDEGVEAGHAGPPPWTARRRFLGVLLLITILAVAGRVVYVLTVTRHQPELYGDQIAYARQAEVLAAGEGFRDPFIDDRTVPNADHPPLTAILATPAYLLTGSRSTGDTAARLMMALVGGVTVFFAGLAGRRAAANVEVDPDSETAHRAGLIAASLAALAPGIWMHDGLIMSEGPGAATVAVVLWAAVRFLDRPTSGRMALVGAALGLAVLARSEAALLVLLLVVPLAFTRRGDRADRRWTAAVPWLGSAAVGLGLVLGPWVGPNLVRFEEPVTLSTNDGSTLLGSNCREAYHGPTVGLWILPCVMAHSDPHAIDASVNAATFRRAGLRYIRGHLADQPRVMAVRVLRTWSLWSPRQEVYLNSGEGDEPWVSWSAIAVSWALMALGVAGWVVLRARDRPVWPFAANAVAVTITSAAFYGLARFRIGADVALLVGAAVALEAGLRRLPHRSGRATS